MKEKAIDKAAAWGAALRERRKRAGFSIDTPDSMQGCSTRFLSEVERGKQSAFVGRSGIAYYTHRPMNDLQLEIYPGGACDKTISGPTPSLPENK